MKLPPVLPLVLCSLAASALSAQGVTLELVPSTTQLTACSSSELSVGIILKNPGRVAIAGYQVFLRFPGAIFKPIRFEPRAVNGFVAWNGPADLGSGFRPCDGDPVDGWADLAGEDVVTVVASAVGSAGGGQFQEENAELGRFFFIPRGASTVAEGAQFRSNEDPCHAGLRETSDVFGADGRGLLASSPASFTVNVAAGGPTVDAFTCTDAVLREGGRGVRLDWVAPSEVGIEFTGFRLFRNGATFFTFPIRSVNSAEDKNPPPGAVRYEIALLLPGGAVADCRQVCSLEWGSVRFQRGDANRDERLNLTDGVAIVSHLFQGGVLGCLDAADVDDTGALELTDAIAVLGYLFSTGTKVPPAPPFPETGLDPTPDDLDCER